MAKRRAVIIGGGVAGLAAALRLGESGAWEPLVLESDARLGGLAKSLHFKGVSTDLGPHRLHTELPEVEKLVSEICAPSIYTVRRKSRINLLGSFLDYPPSPLAALARLGSFRCARFGFSMLGGMLRPAPAAETYESLMERAFGPALYRFLLRPYSEKVWKTDPAQIHPDTARVRVSAGSLAKMVRGLFAKERKGAETSLKEFRYVKGGVETLVRHLAEHAERAGARTIAGRRAERIELAAGSGGDATAVLCGGGAPERFEADAVISTAPLPILVNDLLPAAPALAEAREAARGLTYLNMIFVCVIVRRRMISGDNWLYFPEPRWIFNRAYEAKTFDEGMAPGDRSVLCAEITCRPGDATEALADADVAERALAQLAEAGLFRRDEVEETYVHRLPFGYPLYSLDYHERLDRIFAGLRTIPNLLTTGRQGLFNHNNTDHSIRMGLRAAEALIRHGPAAAEAWYGQVEEFKHFRIVD